MSDIVFVDAQIYDGSGKEPFRGSVHVKPPRIHSVFDYSKLSESEKQDLRDNCKVVNCNGKLAVCPGFIDMHAHSDVAIMEHPSHLAKITQGVTTEVIGQDGIGYAPVDSKCLAQIREQIAGWNGNPQDPAFWCWSSMKEYIDTLETRKIATNVGVLVPQGNLRMLLMGYDLREATPSEIEQMKSMLRVAMREGAIGMSSGLTYVPGMYAPDSELAELLTVVKEFDAYYSPHHRSYGKDAIKAYSEMIDLAKKTDTHLHLTHALLNFNENRGKAPQLLEMLAAARRDGVKISLDTYPYLPGSTILSSLLPSWASEGGLPRTMERLQDPADLQKIRHAVELTGTDGCHGCTVEWSAIEISYVANQDLKPLIGHTISEIGRRCMLGVDDPFDVLVTLLVKDNLKTGILLHVGNEENVRAIMQDPFHCGGSDALLTGAKPHPRSYGCFTRYLGHYGRELPLGKERDIYANSDDIELYNEVTPKSVFPGGIAEAIAHLTSRPAKVLKLKDRGVVAEGTYADLVVFDPETVRDCSTFARPTVPSQGIHYVLVNGLAALEEGKPTHARNGKVLRSNYA